MEWWWCRWTKGGGARSGDGRGVVYNFIGICVQMVVVIFGDLVMGLSSYYDGGSHHGGPCV